MRFGVLSYHRHPWCVRGPYAPPVDSLMDQFIKPVSHYTRKINLIADYVEQMGILLALATGDSLDETKQFVAKQIAPNGPRELKIPQVNFLLRDRNTGDRSRQSVNFLEYLQDAKRRGQIMAPTMTRYLPPQEIKSILAEFILGNMHLRGTTKKAMFQAEIDGLKELRAMLDGSQNTLKIKNNALSGGQVSTSTPLYNKTGHSTLTSTCRVVTSTANANNEKFISGNRHYYSPDIVKANIAAILSRSDFDGIAAVMTRLNIRPPTVAECMSCVERSTQAYWRSQAELDKIAVLFEGMNEIQRSAVVYTSDLYHLAQYNPTVVKDLLDQMAVKDTRGGYSIEEATAILKGADENLVAFVRFLCAEELKGKGTKELMEAAQKGEPNAAHDYAVVASTVMQKRQLIESYSDLINAFWVTDNLPSSIFAVPAMVRRAVLTSDTDSTIFTVQSWVQWHRGRLGFDSECTATANSIVYLAGQLVRHLLATLCGNMGVVPDEIFRLKMKNEYYFPVFTLTSRAKHYFAYMAAQEGLVFTMMKNEIKGVALRSSAVASEIIKLAQETMFDVMDTVLRGDKVSLIAIVRRVATIEREVLEEVATGSFEYFKKTRIQDRDAYKAEDGGNYQFYELWNDVFAAKYGAAPLPPYQAVRASLMTDKASTCKAWLDAMPDQEIAGKLREYLTKKQKNGMGSFLMPMINLLAKGVPSEISSAVDVRSLVAQLMESFYLVMECLGVYRRNKKITTLISDDATILSLPEGVLKPRLDMPKAA